MPCPRCAAETTDSADACAACGSSLVVARLELVKGSLPEQLFELKARSYALGRGHHNDLLLSESSVSKSHARLEYAEGRFSIEDLRSTHGVFVDGVRVERAPLRDGSQIQLGNVAFDFVEVVEAPRTDRLAAVPWSEQQQLLLSILHALSGTLVLNEVLERVLEGIMRITRAERGFVLLADAAGEAAELAGMRVRLGLRRDGVESDLESHGISRSVVRRAVETGQTVATGDALRDPTLASAQSIAVLELRTIVCIPIRSLADDAAADERRPLGALYVDNPESSAPFSPESLAAAEALARHAGLAIENARHFEQERQALRELQRTQKELLHAEKLATIGQMAAGIAHELNTPLTYIMGNLELLQAQDLSEPQKEALRSIGRGAERIHNLAQSLLAFGRPSREGAQPIGVNEMVERGLELCHYHILKGGVRLEKALAEGLPRIRGISSELEMALINLVVNAIQAMDGEGSVTISTARVAGGVEIAVHDTGPGIPSEIQDHLFEPFVTTKDEGQGTGLGLSTVATVVERHDGRIAFTTGLGSGTTFRMTLPTAD
jgi:signal transduction histidine kinase